LKRLAISAVQKSIGLLDRIVETISPAHAGIFGTSVAESTYANLRTVNHKGVSLALTCPSPVSHFRVQTFSTKEPETLDWIDGLTGDVMWDIGANVGIYALYAAKRHPNMKVYAFEPSVLNLELLARNIALNGLEERVIIVPLPLSEKSGPAPFTLSNMDRGGSLSAFGVDYGYDGKAIKKALSYGLYGVSADDIIGKLGLPVPTAIKMDVDGIEHLILRGSRQMLLQPALKTWLIEINNNFSEQHDTCHDLLKSSGFRLIQETHAPIFDTGEWEKVFNTIWRRE
jgi:FkbM family methyltransferase